MSYMAQPIIARPDPIIDEIAVKFSVKPLKHVWPIWQDWCSRFTPEFKEESEDLLARLEAGERGRQIGERALSIERAVGKLNRTISYIPYTMYGISLMANSSQIYYGAISWYNLYNEQPDDDIAFRPDLSLAPFISPYEWNRVLFIDILTELKEQNK